MADSKRIVSFDILKGVGILLVVYGHLYIIPSILKIAIYSFHMPLFFFVSGCFFRPTGGGEFVRKRARQLLLPWAFFAILYAAFRFALNLHETHDLSSATSFIATNVLGGFGGNEDSVIFCTIWFLVCLFEVSVVYLLLHKITPPKCKILIITLLCILLYATDYGLHCLDIDLPYFLDTTMSALIFYHLGYCFKGKKWYDMQVPPMLPAALLVAAVVFVAFFPVKVDMRSNNFPWYLLLLSMVFTVSIYWLIHYVCLRISGNDIVTKFLVWCGTNSLAILGLHVWQIDLIWCVENKLRPTHFGWTLAEEAVIVVICYVLTVLINKYIPFVLGKSPLRHDPGIAHK